MTGNYVSPAAPSPTTTREQARQRFGLSDNELALVERDPALRDFVYTITPLAESSTTSLQRAKQAVERLATALSS